MFARFPPLELNQNAALRCAPKLASQISHQTTPKQYEKDKRSFIRRILMQAAIMGAVARVVFHEASLPSVHSR